MVRSGAEERRKSVREERERTRARDDDGEPGVCDGEGDDLDGG